MVKQAMKTWGHGEDKELLRVLDARQLGLKYIANTTYGYTSATVRLIGRAFIFID